MPEIVPDAELYDTAERTAFEQWWQSRGMLRPSRSSEPGYTHTYESAIAQNAWEAWKARGRLDADS